MNTVAPMNDVARWRFALKPASWPKLLVPAFLGAALGLVHGGGLSRAALAFACLFAVVFTAADAVYIVCLNDVGDEAVDRLKRRMFPAAGGPKTLVDGVLPRGALLRAGLGGAFVAQLTGAAAGLSVGQGAPVLLTTLALLLFAAYTFPPLKLNYRGGGELLETAGVALILPLTVASFFRGDLTAVASAPALAGYVLLSFASAVASGLSDEESDRAGGKRTVVTLFGNRAARAIVALSYIAAMALWARQRAWAPALVLVAALPWLIASLPSATTNAFSAQRTLKHRLHLALWISGVVAAAQVVHRAVTP